jgi:hypothetical protein
VVLGGWPEPHAVAADLAVADLEASPSTKKLISAPRPVPVRYPEDHLSSEIVMMYTAKVPNTDLTLCRLRAKPECLTERVFRRGLGGGPVIPGPPHQSPSNCSPEQQRRPFVMPASWTPPTSPTYAWTRTTTTSGSSRGMYESGRMAPADPLPGLSRLICGLCGVWPGVRRASRPTAEPGAEAGPGAPVLTGAGCRDCGGNSGSLVAGIRETGRGCWRCLWRLARSGPRTAGPCERPDRAGSA